MATSGSGSKEPITFAVPGQLWLPGATRGSGGEAPADPDAGRLKASVRVGALRSGGEPARETAVPGEDIVRLRIQDGPTLRLHPDTARELLAAGSPVLRSGGDAQVVQVGTELSWPGLDGGSAATRGVVQKVVLAGIDILSGRWKGKAADLAAEAIARKMDSQVNAGVYALPREGKLARLKDQPGLMRPKLPLPAGGKPILALVHGTFVETSSTFGKLWEHHPQAVRALFDQYEGAVYALDHPTLGASPFENARTLVDALPTGARLHLLTHSRGGLVAEVLARLAGVPQLAAADLQFFEGKHEAHGRQLAALHAELQKKKVQVDRVVRVACPARGTLLASRRLDAYLSVLQWLLAKTGVPLLAELVDFLDAVAERRTDPRLIPGLESMSPESPVVRWLNQSDLRIPGELRVIAGDLKGDSIGSWLKTLLADAFYWTDNDIVVHTRSMYGGTPRSGGASFLLDQSGAASHFAYFLNQGTVDAVVAGLTQSQPARYRTIGPLSWAGETSDGLRGARPVTRAADGSRVRGGQATAQPSDRPAVLVLPGILGSNLQVGGKRIWLGPRLLGGLDRIAYQPGGADGVGPDGPISLIYDKLIDHLEQSHEVVPFDFDWRRPIEEEADRLADEVEALLDARQASGQPVRLIVHSMGGVVARTMQIVRPEVWQRLMSHADARLVMLGTPNGGSWAPMQVLSGDDTFGNLLVSVGSPFQGREARQLMAQMPGFIQLQAGMTDPKLGLDREETWARLAREDLAESRKRSWWHRSWLADEGPEKQLEVYEWGVPPQAVLDQARRLREKLDAQRDGALAPFAAKILLVVGRSKFTPDGFEVRGEDGFVYRNAVDGGDGRVPLWSARLPGVRTWTLGAEHGSLPTAKEAFAAFDELLQRDTTTLLQPLAEGAGVRGRAGPAAGDGAPAPMHVFSRPSRSRRAVEPAGQGDDLLASAAGPLPEDARSAVAEGPALAVAVVNGNLAFIDVPLFIGHYVSLGLAGTERVVDRLIGGTMSTALALNAGHYPEAIGSHQVFINTLRDATDPDRPAKPAAAIVIGLGEEGKLREAALTATVRQAVLAWLQREYEQRAQAGGAEPAREVRIAATLIGSGGIGISPGTSARAIVAGVIDANGRVEGRGWPLVRRLDLIELYLDRATEAWRELKAVREEGSSPFTLGETVEFGSGPLRRPLDSGYRGADYDFIRVSSQGKGKFEFAVDSRRARTELREQSTQAELVQEIVRNAATDTQADPQLGRTLYQLLVPPALDPYLKGNGRFLLELDSGAAGIPWELLDTRPEGQDADQRPWALRCGLLRKLRLSADAAVGTARRDALADHDILVIGEPLVDRPGYPKLQGAIEEATAVAELFNRRLGRDDRPVIPLLEKRALPIINALYERDWRIVHVAGHGESGRDGGVVLSGRAFLGANEIKAMRTVPELVFVNCCHTARLGEGDALDTKRDFRPGDFAAGVAGELIRIGVRCVVAAGWAVNDGPAQAFATRFYERLLSGDTFGRALADARELAHSLGGNTWAAYQCYGDPDWRLRSGTADAQRPATPLADEYGAIASPLGLTLALEALATGSRWEQRPAAGQLARIGHLEGRWAASMGSIGAVAEAFGVAYAEAKALGKAVEWLQRAVQASDGTASMKAAEQYGNLAARLAYEQVRPGGKRVPSTKDLAQAQSMAHGALLQLRTVATSRPTPETLSLVGSACKRLVMIEQMMAGEPARAAVAAHLAEMLQSYEHAARLARDGNAKDWFYPAQNLLAAEVRQRLLDAKAPEPRALLRKEVEQQLRKGLDTDRDGWNRLGLIELRLHDALLADSATALEAIMRSHAELYKTLPAPRLWATVADQIDFLAGGPAAARGKGSAMSRLVALVRSFAEQDA